MHASVTHAHAVRLRPGLLGWMALAFAATLCGGNTVIELPLTNRSPQVVVLPGAPIGWWRVGGDFFDATSGPPVLTLEVSTNLRQWSPAAVLREAPFQFTDPASANVPTRFYRLAVSPRTETNDWANQLLFPYDALFNSGECGADRVRWAKFAIVLAEPHRVYFQDSAKFLLHHEFATNRLAGFHNLTPEQFNAVALRRGNQRILLGAVLSPLNGPPEFGIQFVGLDPYSPEFVAQVFEIVRSAIANESATAFYLPTFEQAASAREHESFFAARGIQVMSAERWLGGAASCYAPGWAVGRLQFIPAAEINASYANGRLGPGDILLTDGVPAEIPYVSGIVSLAPATPNSHVAILAQSYGVPFVYLADATERQRITNLVGRLIALRTGRQLTECDITLLDVNDALSAEVTNHIAVLKSPSGIAIAPKEAYGAISAPTTNLTAADIRFFGGKAANFGLLRRVIPTNSPDAIAFSFDLWDAFLDQTTSGGATLREAIRTRLGGFTYPPNVASLRVQLAAVRSLITSAARFSPAQRQAILFTLMRFDSSRNIRFRSSTNVEDAERFSGAGLYDSFSGCLADDLDADTTGPSACDPTEAEERGVFRAIQKVYASFYNENAFLERLRHGLDEDDVGMGLLVHYSTPDEIELANGVATPLVFGAGNTWSVSGPFVTQAGAVSVANPDGSATPEIMSVYWSPRFTNVTPKQASSLVPLGTRVLQWPGEYEQLAGLVGAVAVAYARPLTNRSKIQLDFEYKKEAPGHLSVKQVREVPQVDGNRLLPAFLLSGSPVDLCPWGDAFAVHRLKSRWSLAARSVLLDENSLAANLYTFGHAELLVGTDVVTLTGSPSSWPEATHAVNLTNNFPGGGWLVEDRFALSTGAARRELALSVTFPRNVSPMECPWLTLSDALLQLSARYDTPEPLPGQGDTTIMTTSEAVSLLPCRLSAGTDLMIWPLTATNRTVQILTTQHLVRLIGRTPDAAGLDPRCNVIGPKSSFGFTSLKGQTRIVGLLSNPLVLENEYAQTFLVRGRYGHETVQELICDPWLEPSLTAAQRSELTAANVRLLYYYSYRFGDATERFLVLGLNGMFRAIP